jgi:hypothetical protein
MQPTAQELEKSVVTINPEQLKLFIQQAEARYMVALYILLGMVAVALGAIALALGLRKTCFLFLGAYGLLMTNLGIGFCYIFGPVVLMASAGGLMREWFIGGRKKVNVVAPSSQPAA